MTTKTINWAKATQAEVDEALWGKKEAGAKEAKLKEIERLKREIERLEREVEES